MALSREKIALVFFSALILLGLGGLVGYLEVGHSWNVAASNIDDAAGSMDGYTTILYEGTVIEQPAKDKAKEAPVDASGAAVLPTLQEGLLPTNGTAQQDESSSGNNDRDATDALPDSGTAGEGNDLPATPDDDAGLSGTAADGSVGDGRESMPEDEGEAVSGDSTDADVPGAGTAKKDPLLVLGDVEESYLEKNATVFTLDTTGLVKYREGIILMKGGHRFGVFSIESTDTAFRIERQVGYFQKHAVDFIVALTPDMGLVEQVAGIDIVISTQDEGLFNMGETIDDTFYVSAPGVGSVGAILISPSNVVSAKVISEI